jgi:acetylornithine/N-succinyldiaminopimelate aminotransferase
MLEPVQGEGGVYPAEPGYLARAAEIAHAHGALLVLDEVQSGLWRTGLPFAHQADGVKPDIVMVAKALANGLPAGAVLVADEVAGVMEPGDHGSTFGGGPVVAAAALATLRALEVDALGVQAERIGEYLRSGLRAIADAHPAAIAEVRGRGQMNAVEFEAPIAGILAERGLASGFVLNAIGTHILRFLPPLLCDTEEVDRLVGTLDILLADTEITRICEDAAQAAEAADPARHDPRKDTM